MRLRTFNADDMQDAMQMVRDALGGEAIIISAKSLDGKGGVQVTAAYEDLVDNADDNEYESWFDALCSGENYTDNNDNHESSNFEVEEERVNFSISGAKLTSAKSNEVRSEINFGNIPIRVAHNIEKLLKHHGVNESVMEYLFVGLDSLNSSDAASYSHHKDSPSKWFASLMERSFNMSPINIVGGSSRHILIGTSGAGKTLTTAKIAVHHVQNNRPVHIITVDNKKAGGVAQLAAITDILGIELLIAESRAALKEMLANIPLAETVVIDSAGANPYNFYELKELAEYANLIEVDPVLVYAAGGDPHEADEIARAFSFIGVEKMIVTKIDAARRFGGILNAAHSSGLKFANITGTEKILGGFEPCTADLLTKLFMDYQPVKEL